MNDELRDMIESPRIGDWLLTNSSTGQHHHPILIEVRSLDPFELVAAPLDQTNEYGEPFSGNNPWRVIIERMQTSIVIWGRGDVQNVETHTIGDTTGGL